MPVYLDETYTDDMNPNIINFAVLSDTPLVAPEHTITFKLKPIHITFQDFQKLFFKKRRTLYTTARLCFLNELLNKIKPKLSLILQSTICVSNRASILLNRELFDMVLETRIKSRVALTHSNLVRAINTTNDTYIRITLSLGIVAISSAVNIEFMFNVRNIPLCEVFNADDLFNNNYDLFHGAISCGGVCDGGGECDGQEEEGECDGQEEEEEECDGQEEEEEECLCVGGEGEEECVEE
jgi:hypothetical protein